MAATPAPHQHEDAEAGWSTPGAVRTTCNPCVRGLGCSHVGTTGGEALIQARGIHLAIVLSVAAALAAGCGSSSSSKSGAKPAASTPAGPSTVTTPATPAAFSAELNAVCKQFNAAPSTPAATEAFLAKLIAFTPPGEQTAVFDKFVQAEHAARAPGAARNQSEVTNALAQVRAAAIALHAPDCQPRTR